MSNTVKQLERLREWGQNPLTKKSEKQQIKFALEESPTPIVKNPVLKKAINDQQEDQKIRRKNHYNKLYGISKEYNGVKYVGSRQHLYDDEKRKPIEKKPIQKDIIDIYNPSFSNLQLLRKTVDEIKPVKPLQQFYSNDLNRGLGALESKIVAMPLPKKKYETD
jgi:hypothetical protein